ncbi:MAG: acyltransferase [Lachnospiraceae bacterium]|nr:acyltransferase [Lachnospiraceae bacterium]
MKKRENGVELLRILAAFLVCAVHVCNVEREQAIDPDIVNASFHYFWLVFTMAQAGVAVFIALSGAFTLKAHSTTDYAPFYKKAKSRIVMPTIVFSIFYIFFEGFINYISGAYADKVGDNVSLIMSFVFKLPMAVMGYPATHMWYMFMLMVMYLLLPFVAIAKEKMGEKNFLIASWVMWILGTIDAVSSPPKVSYSLGYCADILGIIMLGYQFHEWGLKRKGKTSQAIGMIAGGSAVILVEYLLIYLPLRNTSVAQTISLQRPHNPLLALGALILVAGFTMLDIKVNLGYLGALTLWVYIVHPAVMEIVFIIEGRLSGVPFTEIGITAPVLVGTVNTIIVFILSFVMAHLIEKWRGRKA